MRWNVLALLVKTWFDRLDQICVVIYLFCQCWILNYDVFTQKIKRSWLLWRRPISVSFKNKNLKYFYSTLFINYFVTGRSRSNIYIWKFHDPSGRVFSVGLCTKNGKRKRNGHNVLFRIKCVGGVFVGVGLVWVWVCVCWGRVGVCRGRCECGCGCGVWCVGLWVCVCANFPKYRTIWCKLGKIWVKICHF